MSYAKALRALNTVSYAALREANSDATVSQGDRAKLRRLAIEIDNMVDALPGGCTDHAESNFRRAVTS